MKKLSLKEYKKRCAELWNWLADNPKNIKSDWPKWKTNGGKYKKAINLCFACEFSSIGSLKICCNKCFLLDLWYGKKLVKNDCVAPCEVVTNSPYKLYRKWDTINIPHMMERNIKKRSFYARKIADYCKEH